MNEPYRKYYIKLKILFEDKHSSLFSGGRKECFSTLTPQIPDYPENRTRGRSLALIIPAGDVPVEVEPRLPGSGNDRRRRSSFNVNNDLYSDYDNYYSRRLDSTVSFNSVWLGG